MRQYVIASIVAGIVAFGGLALGASMFATAQASDCTSGYSTKPKACPTPTVTQTPTATPTLTSTPATGTPTPVTTPTAPPGGGGCLFGPPFCNNPTSTPTPALPRPTVIAPGGPPPILLSPTATPVRELPTRLPNAGS